MLHRLQIDGISREGQSLRDLLNAFAGTSVEILGGFKRVLRGPACSPRLVALMCEAQLPSPRLTNHRVRFYFTDFGWHRIGAKLLHEARALGYAVKYTRRGKPRQSQIVYEDEYQVALLPIKRKSG